MCVFHGLAAKRSTKYDSGASCTADYEEELAVQVETALIMSPAMRVYAVFEDFGGLHDDRDIVAARVERQADYDKELAVQAEAPIHITSDARVRSLWKTWAACTVIVTSLLL